MTDSKDPESPKPDTPPVPEPTTPSEREAGSDAPPRPERTETTPFGQEPKGDSLNL